METDEFVAAMSAVTANLQHRKWTQQRLKELETETEKALGDCVLLVQELSSTAEGAAAIGLGEGVHANRAGTACVVLPKSVRRHVVESELGADAWCCHTPLATKGSHNKTKHNSTMRSLLFLFWAQGLAGLGASRKRGRGQPNVAGRSAKDAACATGKNVIAGASS